MQSSSAAAMEKDAAYLKMSLAAIRQRHVRFNPKSVSIAICNAHADTDDTQAECQPANGSEKFIRTQNAAA